MRPLIWPALLAAIAVPVALAATSPLLQWRDGVYIAAGFAGIAAMALLLVQPLLAIRALPGLNPKSSLRAHRMTGGGLLIAIALHVVGLYATSPPDVIDALTFTSPTLFSPFGVIAMWAALAAALVAILRREFAARTWRRAHTGLALVVAATTAAHVALIEGAMEPVSKTLLSLAALAAAALAARRIWRR